MDKILFITAYTPGPGSAGQNYTLQLLNDLAGKAEIDLVYFRFEDQEYYPSHPSINVIESVPMSPLRKLLNVLSLPLYHPIFTARFSWSMMMKLRRLTREKKYKFVYLDFSQVFVYGLFLKQVNQVLMCHDVILQKYSRQGTVLERVWVQFSERTMLQLSNQKILTFSSKDVTLIKEHYNREATAVNFFIASSIRELKSETKFDRKTVCFFGAWNRPENYEGLLWFLKEVAPRISLTAFIVIGGKLPSHIADILNAQKGFTYTGFVENPYEIISRCHALIAPIFKGAGVKVKVIEALACGTSVIGTPVALEGIPDQVNEGVLEVNTAEEFANAINKLDPSPSLGDFLRSWFADNYKTQSDALLANS